MELLSNRTDYVSRRAGVLLCAVLSCGAVIGNISGCGNAMIAAKEAMGIPKREQMVARVTDARDSQTEAKEQFQSALDEFLSVTKVDGGDLEVKYKKFKSEYESSVAAADTVNKRITEVERVATALFSEWQKEIGDYSSASMKATSQAELAATQAQYGRLLGSMKSAATTMEKPLANFKDQVLYLKHKLNARAIAGLEGTARELSTDVANLIQEMNRSIDESNAFIGQIQSGAS
jgi:hypothetical protein